MVSALQLDKLSSTRANLQCRRIFMQQIMRLRRMSNPSRAPLKSDIHAINWVKSEQDVMIGSIGVIWQKTRKIRRPKTGYSASETLNRYLGYSFCYKMS